MLYSLSRQGSVKQASMIIIIIMMMMMMMMMMMTMIMIPVVYEAKYK